MKKLIQLIILLCLTMTSAAFAEDIRPQTLTDNDFNSLSAGEVEISEIDQLDGGVGDYSDDLIHIKDIGKDDTHGNSLVFQKGNLEEDYKTTAGTTMLKIKTGSKNDDGTYNSCDTEVVVEYDFYWSGNFKSPERYIMYLYGEADGNAVLDSGINVTDGYFEFNKYTSGQSAVRYSKGKWYRAVHKINLIDDTYTYSLYNMDGTLASSASGPLKTALDSLSEIRFTMNMSQADDVGVEKYIAFDNLKVTYNDILPEITSVKYADANGDYRTMDGECPAGVTKIRLMLAAPFKTEVDAEECLDFAVSGLERDDIALPVKTFEYVKSGAYIDVEFETGLKAGAVYTVSLNDNAKTSFGNSLYSAVKCDIVTESDAVTDCTFADGENGEVNISVEFLPREMRATVIAVVYSENTMTAAKACDVTVDEDNHTATLSVEAAAGDTVEVYVWDSLESGKSIISRLYKVKK